MEFVWRDEGISNHTEMNGVTLTKVGVVSNDVDVTFTGIYAPTPSQITALFGHS
jgi:hypothetical protein